jgi:CheY-like chemotaxis protein
MTSILVVEDEFGIAEAIYDLLSDEGYEVRLARNGAEGLAAIRAQRPALVLLDVMMPVLDGRALLRQLRADPELRALPVVVMSAVNPSRLDLDLSYDAFLHKPFDIEALLAQVLRLAGPAVK